MWQSKILLIFGVLGAVSLLAASAFFSASETALVSLSAQKAKRIALKKPKFSKALLGWLGQPHELLSLILVGNTIANIMFAAVVTAVAVHLLRSFSPSLIELGTWAVETLLVLILADMAPKFYARANPEKTSLIVLPWLSRLRFLFGPLISFAFGIFYPKRKSALLSPVLTFSLDELKGLLEEGQPNSTVQADSVSMMQRVLDINQRKAESIMTPLSKVDMVEIDPKGKYRERDLLLDLIIEEGHTRTPVKKGGEIIGFIHTDDLLPFILRDPGIDLTRLVRQAMDIPNTRLVSDLLQDFRTSGIYTGFVRDEKGTLLGLVTLEDVLEEITGEILDEFDVAYTQSQTKEASS